jgi:hypothetical protein
LIAKGERGKPVGETHRVGSPLAFVGMRPTNTHRSVEEAALPGLYFTSAPNRDEAYQVGDRIEVMCDHDRSGERVRDWLEGTVVQVDPKMIAVQFQENVYLTDGWMVPDHVLWCPKDSSNIRKAMRRKRRVRPRPAGRME